MKKAFITGITGQDGSYLSELLLEKGYEVHGLIRRSSVVNTGRIAHLIRDKDIFNKKLYLHYGDLTDSSSIFGILAYVKPDEIYNLGAQSDVKISFDTPEYTGDATGLGTLRILEAINKLKLDTRFYQASTSELFGKVLETPQKETTPFNPRSPYGVAKLYAFWILKNYRDAYNIFACNGILFNHESERRGKNFVTRKITSELAKVKEGLVDCLYLGNMDSKRDWGYAKDYVKAMWLMLQQDKPDDYVVSTGELHTVREFVEAACDSLDFDLEWQGSGIDEIGVDKKSGKTIVKVNPEFFRPTEVDLLLGDCSKAKNAIGWEPKTKFEDLVKIMVEADLKKVKSPNGY